MVVSGDFLRPSIATDTSGAVHIAAEGSASDNKGIWYITNASGGWTQERVTIPRPDPDMPGSERDGEPLIAVDTDGSIWIAYTYWSCGDCAPNPSDGVFLVNNVGGSWSEPQQIGEIYGRTASLAVRDGLACATYAELHPYADRLPLWFATNAGGEWAASRLTRDGQDAKVLIDDAGRFHVLFATKTALRYGVALPLSEWSLSTVSTGSKLSLGLAIDPVDGTSWVGWSDHDSGGNFIAVAGALDDGTWSTPERAIADAMLTGMGVHDGVWQVLGFQQTASSSGALLYANNAKGAFEVQQLADASGWESALTVDAAGRGHVVFTLDSPNAQRGIWYALGPKL